MVHSCLMEWIRNCYLLYLNSKVSFGRGGQDSNCIYILTKQYITGKIKNTWGKTHY